MSDLKYESIRQLPIEELIKEYDKIADNTSVSNVGLNFYLSEIYRRDQEQINIQILGYSKKLHGMTIIITVATLINLFVIFLQALR
jgi:hypothetical protein